MVQQGNKYYNRLVVDLDDTLSFTNNRDFENAVPNLPLIEKINTLYDKGWEIYIVTARGQLSCDGNISKIKDKYEKQIKRWLNANNVKYQTLSFEKPLATYYIDDKAITPDDFIDLEIREIKSGWSGDSVFKIGDKIYKTQKNCHEVVEWYKQAEMIFNIPKIYSVVGNTIQMEYVGHVPSEFNLYGTLELIKKMRTIIPLKNGSFDSFFNKISDHVNNEPEFKPIMKTLERHRSFFLKENETFCHGDFSKDNLLVNEKGEVFLIDPIPGGWSHWLLDLSKFIYSLRRDGYVNIVEHVYEIFNYHRRETLVLEACQWVRVYKYAPDHKKSMIIDGFKKVMQCLK